MSGTAIWSTEVLRSVLHVVTEERWTNVILDHLMRQEYLGIDCEGVNLGRDGKVTLVQVATPVGDVFIFDMLEKTVHSGVRTLLQSNVLKIMHGCRGDVANLFVEHGILCQQVVDTQWAQLQIDSTQNQNGKQLKPGLNELNAKYGVPTNPLKGKIDYAKNQRYWETRPLTQDMKHYAASDVISLVKLYPLIKSRIAQPKEFLETCTAKIREIIFNSGSPKNVKPAAVTFNSDSPKNVKPAAVIFNSGSPKNVEPAAVIDMGSLLMKTMIVRNKSDSQQVTAYILKQRYIAVDVKTVQTDGDYDKLRLFQVGTESGQVYVFDMTSTIVLDYIKSFMENSGVTKVMHDCRDAISSLYFYHGMRVNQIFDTQLAQRVITSAQPGTTNHNIGLDELCKAYRLPSNPYRNQAFNWSQRPITQGMENLVVYDVYAILKLYARLLKNVNIDHVKSRSHNRVVQLQKVVDDKKNSNCESNEETEDDVQQSDDDYDAYQDYWSYNY